MNNNFPKILIFGQSFNKNTGGGITLSNLFKGWPIDKIAVANTGHGMFAVDYSICNTYYVLGKHEHKWVFPFNIMQRQFESGVSSTAVTVSANSFSQNIDGTKEEKKYRKLFVEKIFYPALSYCGIMPKVSKIILSKPFKEWVKKYEPDIIYVQVSNLASINFVLALKQYLQKPVILHMMDDWPSIIGGNGPLKKYWNDKIDIALRQLMKQSSLLMSISDAMTEEYQHRYGLNFLSFHNPINIEDWLPYSKNCWKVNSTFKILYTGRIGTANTESIKTIAKAVAHLADKGLNISLDIYSPNIHSDQANTLKFLKGVTLKNIVPHSLIPSLLPSYDLLVLPLDFDHNSVRFARLSMPTKASEFMISGTPILVYAHIETALAKYADKEKWAYLVSEANESLIINSIKKIYSSASLRQEFGQKAKMLALKNEDADLIRRKFREAIYSVKNY